MAQTYRRTKIEEFRTDIERSLNFTVEKMNRETDESFKRYLKGQAETYEHVLKNLEWAFNLTAE